MAQIVLPHRLTNGTVADATQVMANFDAIVNVVNGNLGSDNLGSLSGADVTVTDLNGGTIILNNFTRRFAAGTVTFNNVPPNETMSQTVQFPISFPGQPYVFTQFQGSATGQVFTSPSNVGASQFTLNIRHSFNSNSTIPVRWLAVYAGSFS